MKTFLWVLLIIFLPLLGILGWKSTQIPAFTDPNCIRAVIGESSADGETGMLCVAHAIRNRGTLKGVYGFNAKHINTEPKKVRILASLVWFESESRFDPTYGATEWRSKKDLKKHGAPKGFEETIRYKDHVFYRRIK